MKVLIIDDEEDTRSIASMSLSILGGVDVSEAEGGLEGIAKAEQDPPDVILLDMMMPVMDGCETLMELQKNPRTSRIPVIFLTAKAMSTEVDRLKRLGAVAVLTKPFDPTTLAAQVEKILDSNGLKVTPSSVPAGEGFQIPTENNPQPQPTAAAQRPEPQATMQAPAAVSQPSSNLQSSQSGHSYGQVEPQSPGAQGAASTGSSSGSGTGSQHSGQALKPSPGQLHPRGYQQHQPPPSAFQTESTQQSHLTFEQQQWIAQQSITSDFPTSPLRQNSHAPNAHLAPRDPYNAPQHMTGGYSQAPLPTRDQQGYNQGSQPAQSTGQPPNVPPYAPAHGQSRMQPPQPFPQNSNSGQQQLNGGQQQPGQHPSGQHQSGQHPQQPTNGQNSSGAFPQHPGAQNLSGAFPQQPPDGQNLSGPFPQYPPNGQHMSGAFPEQPNNGQNLSGAFPQMPLNGQLPPNMQQQYNPHLAANPSWQQGQSHQFESGAIPVLPSPFSQLEQLRYQQSITNPYVLPPAGLSPLPQTNSKNTFSAIPPPAGGNTNGSSESDPWVVAATENAQSNSAKTPAPFISPAARTVPLAPVNAPPAAPVQYRSSNEDESAQQEAPGPAPPAALLKAAAAKSAAAKSAAPKITPAKTAKDTAASKETRQQELTQKENLEKKAEPKEPPRAKFAHPWGPPKAPHWSEDVDFDDQPPDNTNKNKKRSDDKK